MAGFANEFRMKAKNLGITRRVDLQVSIINDKKIFVFHDWEDMIGNPASYHGLDSMDMYEEIFKYHHGVVAWVDRKTNVPLSKRELYRYNLAVFSNIQDSEWRIVVETHHEVL